MTEDIITCGGVKAIVKYNNGDGALLCNSCRYIIATGFDHDRDVKHYCEKCKNKK